MRQTEVENRLKDCEAVLGSLLRGNDIRAIVQYEPSAVQVLKQTVDSVKRMSDEAGRFAEHVAEQESKAASQEADKAPGNEGKLEEDKPEPLESTAEAQAPERAKGGSEGRTTSDSVFQSLKQGQKVTIHSKGREEKEAFRTGVGEEEPQK